MENQLGSYDIYKAGVAGYNEGVQRQQTATEMAAYGDAQQAIRMQNRLAYEKNKDALRMLEVNNMVDSGVGNMLMQQQQAPAAPQQQAPDAPPVQNNLAPRMITGPTVGAGQIMPGITNPSLSGTPQQAGNPVGGTPPQQSQLQQQLDVYKSLRTDNKIDDKEYGKLVTGALTSSNAQAGAELEQFGKLTEMVKKGGGPAKFGELVNSGFFDGIAPPETLKKLKAIDYSKMKTEADFTEYTLDGGGKLVSGRDADGKPYTHVLPPVKDEKLPQTPEGGYYDGLKAEIAKANPSWDKEKVEMVAGKQIIAEKAAAAANKTAVTIQMREKSDERKAEYKARMGSADSIKGFASGDVVKANQALTEIWLSTGKIPESAFGRGSKPEIQKRRDRFYANLEDVAHDAHTTLTALMAGTVNQKTTASAMMKQKNLIANTEVNATQAEKNIKQLRGMLPALGNKAVPLLNSVMNRFAKHLGAPAPGSAEFVAYETMIEYTKVVTGQTTGAAPTDSAMKNTADLISVLKDTPGQIGAKFDSMQTLMNNKRQSQTETYAVLGASYAAGVVPGDTTPATGGSSYSDLLNKHRK